MVSLSGERSDSYMVSEEEVSDAINPVTSESSEFNRAGKYQSALRFNSCWAQKSTASDELHSGNPSRLAAALKEILFGAGS
jgi:hypothetical protein